MTLARDEQRTESLRIAINLLDEALGDERFDAYSVLEQEGVVQRFEYTFELFWKVLKDRLTGEGFDDSSPRSVFRRSLEAGIVSAADVEVLLQALASRNLLSHTYNQAMADQALSLIQETFFPVMQRVCKGLTDG
jgi:nucleotidyltransferase substrate binding protein (TIGR01987 family)